MGGRRIVPEGFGDEVVVETLPESRLNLVEFKARAYMSEEYKLLNPLRGLRRLVRGGRRRRRRGRRARAAHYAGRRLGGGRGPGRPYTGGRQPRRVPYERHSRDADGDGLVQEGTIWERPVGSGVHGQDGRELADGVSSSDSAFTSVRNAAGEPTGYKPGDNRASSLYQGARGVADGRQRAQRARRQAEQAARDRTVKPREREVEESEAKLRRRISIVLEEDNIDRMLEAEERVGATRSEEALGFWMSFAEGFTGVRMGLGGRTDKDSKKGSGSALTEELKRLSEGAIVALGEQRHIADRAGHPITDDDRRRQNQQDNQILPPSVDRAEHYRKMKEDAAYRRAFILSMIHHDENNDNYVYPPDYKHPTGRTRAGAKETAERQFRTKPHLFDDDELAAAIALAEGKDIKDRTDEEKAYLKSLKAERTHRNAMSAAERTAAHAARVAERERIKDEKKKTVDEIIARKKELQKAWDDGPEKMSSEDLKEHLAGLSPDDLRKVSKEYGTKLTGHKDDKIDAIIGKIRPEYGPPVPEIDDLDPEDPEYARRLREDPKALRKWAKVYLIEGRGTLTDPGHEKYDPEEAIRRIIAKRTGKDVPEPVETPEPKASKYRDIGSMSREEMKKELEKLIAEGNAADADRITALNTALGRVEEKKPKQKKPVDGPSKPEIRTLNIRDWPDYSDEELQAHIDEYEADPDPVRMGMLLRETREERQRRIDEGVWSLETPEVSDAGDSEELSGLAGVLAPREGGGIEPPEGWSDTDFSTWSDARLDYEIRHGLEFAGSEYADPIKTSAMLREWDSRESNADRPSLLDESREVRGDALLEAQQQMADHVEENWEQVIRELEDRNRSFDLPPPNGLPDRKFFEDDSEMAGRYGRYYGPGGDLNDHGILMNEGIAEFRERSAVGAEVEEAIAEVEQAEAKIIEQARDRKLPRDIDPARVPEDVVGEDREHAQRLIELAGYAQMQKLRNENPDVPDDKLYRLAREVDLGNDPAVSTERSWSWGEGSEIPADMEDLPDETLDRITEEALAEFDRRAEIEQLRTETDPETHQPLRLGGLTDKEIEAQIRLQHVGRDRVDQGLEDTGWVKHDPDYLKRLTAERAAREERGDWTDPDLPPNPRVAGQIKKLEKEIEEIEAAVAKIKPNQRTHKPKGQRSMSRDRAHAYYGGLRQMKRSRIQQLQEELDNEGRDAPEADVPEAPALDVPPADDDGFPYGGEYPAGLEGSDAQHAWLNALPIEKRKEWLRAGIEKQEKSIYNKLVYDREGSADPDLGKHYHNRMIAARQSPWIGSTDPIDDRKDEAFHDYINEMRDALLSGDETEGTRLTAPEMFDAAVAHAEYHYDGSGLPTEREAYWGGAMPQDMDPDEVETELAKLYERMASDDVLSDAESNRVRLLATYQAVFNDDEAHAVEAVRKTLSDYERLDEDSPAHAVDDVKDRLEAVDTALANRVTSRQPLEDSLVPLRASVYEAVHGEPYPDRVRQSDEGVVPEPDVPEDVPEPDVPEDVPEPDVPEDVAPTPPTSTGKQKIRIIEPGEEGEWRIHAKNAEGQLLGQRRAPGSENTTYVLLEEVREGVYKPVHSSRQPHGPMGRMGKYTREKYEDEGGWQFFDDLDETSEWPEGGSQESFSFISDEEFRATTRVTKLQSEAPKGDEATRQGRTTSKKKTPKKTTSKKSTTSKKVEEKKKEVEKLKAQIAAMNEESKKRAGKPESLQAAKKPDDAPEPTVEDLEREMAALLAQIEAGEEAEEAGVDLDVSLERHHELMGDLDEVQAGIDDLERLREEGGLTDEQSETVADEIATLTTRRDEMSEYQDQHAEKEEQAGAGQEAEGEGLEAEEAAFMRRPKRDDDEDDEEDAPLVEAAVPLPEDESEVDESGVAVGEGEFERDIDTMSEEERLEELDRLSELAEDEESSAYDDRIEALKESLGIDDDEEGQDGDTEIARINAEAKAKRAAAKEKLKNLSDKELKDIVQGGSSVDMQVVGPGHRLAETHLGREVDEGLEPRDSQAYARLLNEVKQGEIVNRGLRLFGWDSEARDVPASIGSRTSEARQVLLNRLAERDGISRISNDSKSPYFRPRLPDGSRTKDAGVHSGFLIELKDEDLVDGPDGKRGFYVPVPDGEGGFRDKFVEGNWTVVPAEIEGLDAWLRQRNRTEVQRLVYDSAVNPRDVKGTGPRPAGKKIKDPVTGEDRTVRDAPLTVLVSDMESYISQLEQPLRTRKRGAGSDADRMAARELLQDRINERRASPDEQVIADEAARKKRREGLEVVRDEETGVLNVEDNRSIEQMRDAIDDLMEGRMSRRQQAELRSVVRDLVIKWMSLDEDEQAETLKNLGLENPIAIGKEKRTGNPTLDDPLRRLKDFVREGAVVGERAPRASSREEAKPDPNKPLFDDKFLHAFLTGGKL